MHNWSSNQKVDTFQTHFYQKFFIRISKIAFSNFSEKKIIFTFVLAFESCQAAENQKFEQKFLQKMSKQLQECVILKKVLSYKQINGYLLFKN